MTARVSSTPGYIDRAFEFLDRVEYRLAQTATEKDDIYRLRYRAYLNEGAIEANPLELLTDRFDGSPNSWLFGLFIDGILVSSLRICIATPLMSDTPAVDAFPDLLKPLLAQGKTIVDPNRFVADPNLAPKYPLLPYMTLRLAYVACVHFEADVGTATVRPEHRAFYRRVFLHSSLCEPRPYPTLTKPLGLMTVDYHAFAQKVFERYPFFRSTEHERNRLFGKDAARPLPAVIARRANVAPRAEAADARVG